MSKQSPSVMNRLRASTRSMTINCLAAAALPALIAIAGSYWLADRYQRDHVEHMLAHKSTSLAACIGLLTPGGEESISASMSDQSSGELGAVDQSLTLDLARIVAAMPGCHAMAQVAINEQAELSVISQVGEFSVPLGTASPNMVAAVERPQAWLENGRVWLAVHVEGNQVVVADGAEIAQMTNPWPIMAVLGGCAVLMAVYLANRICRPINAVVAAIDEVRHGTTKDFKLAMRSDETSVLASSVEDLVDHLRPNAIHEHTADTRASAERD